MEANQLQAKDFRLGNIVTLSEKVRQELWDEQIEARNDYFTIDVVWSDGDVCLKLDVENVEMPAKDVSGLPLSEDVLLRLGFEKYSAENFKHKNLEKLRAYLQPIRNGYGIYLAGCYTLPHIKSVHQLQNLYHSLTGEELTFKK